MTAVTAASKNGPNASGGAVLVPHPAVRKAR
jgi:hypothetical protein